MLNCSCGGEDYDWWHYEGKITTLCAKRARRCVSCKAKIKVGDDCMVFERFRVPNCGSIEERIYGEGGEVPMANHYLCDRCAGLYESLDSLGFCDLLGQDLRVVCKEYAEMQREAGVFRGQMILTPNAALTGAEGVRVEGTVRGENPGKD